MENVARPEQRLFVDLERQRVDQITKVAGVVRPDCDRTRLRQVMGSSEGRLCLGEIDGAVPWEDSGVQPAPYGSLMLSPERAHPHAPLRLPP